MVQTYLTVVFDSCFPRSSFCFSNVLHRSACLFASCRNVWRLSVFLLWLRNFFSTAEILRRFLATCACSDVRLRYCSAVAFSLYPHRPLSYIGNNKQAVHYIPNRCFFQLLLQILASFHQSFTLILLSVRLVSVCLETFCFFAVVTQLASFQQQ